MKITKEEFNKIKSNFKKPRQVKILTGSMDPFIKAGDRVTIRPFNSEDLKEFDTIVFWQDDKLICHFLYKKEVRSDSLVYHTKGLNSKELDSPVNEEQILGVVTAPTLPSWKKFLMRFIF
ncbi:MAG: hypothetical protein CME64_13740 [Halobacteriovoraceae bacterium]|nr:hypothetical protein [Halobacteriovoraceae bacterium]